METMASHSAFICHGHCLSLHYLIRFMKSLSNQLWPTILYYFHHFPRNNLGINLSLFALFLFFLSTPPNTFPSHNFMHIIITLALSQKKQNFKLRLSLMAELINISHKSIMVTDYFASTSSCYD